MSKEGRNLEIRNGVSSLALRPFGNSEVNVPEGQLRIVQPFSVGMDVTPEQVPKGRLKDGATPFTFSRPFGTQILPTSFPALKRRATLALSLRDGGSRYDPGISERHSALGLWDSFRFRGFGLLASFVICLSIT